MSPGLGHGKALDDAPGVVGISSAELPPLPDDLATNPEGARIDPRGWFPEPAERFELEIGSGKGTFLVQQVDADRTAGDASTNYLGIEWTREFYVYAADRVRRRQGSGSHHNVRLLHTDATQFLKWRVPSGIIDVIHLYFSDPWPKTKHHKKRVVQHWSMAEFWRTLRPGGELRVVTDHDDLWAWMDSHFNAWTQSTSIDDLRAAGRAAGIGDADATLPARTSAELSQGEGAFFDRLGFDRPGSAREGELVGTNFERKFREEGRSFHSVVLRKTDRAG